MTASGAGVIVGDTKAKGGDVIDVVAMTILWILSSVSDLREYQIPNDLILAGWLAALVCRLYIQGIYGMGAGDIKLLSVVGAMYGMKLWIQTGIVFALLAALFSFVYMLINRLFVNRMRYFFHFVILDHKKSYYDATRDGRSMVIPLAPVMALAYYMVFFCRLSGGMKS